MFFLLLPLSSATADDLAGLRRTYPRAFRLAQSRLRRRRTWQVPTTPAPFGPSPERYRFLVGDAPILSIRD